MLYYVAYNTKSVLAHPSAAPIRKALEMHTDSDGVRDCTLLVVPNTPESADSILLQLLTTFYNICMAPHATQSMKPAETAAYQCGSSRPESITTATLPLAPVRIICTNDNHLRLQAVHLFLSMPFQMPCVLLVPIYAPPADAADKGRYHKLWLDDATATATASAPVLFYSDTDGSTTRMLAALSVETLIRMAKNQRLRGDRYINHRQLTLPQRLVPASSSPRSAACFVDGDDLIPLVQLPPIRVNVTDVWNRIQDSYTTRRLRSHTQ